MKILIHHHAPVYLENGDYFVQSFIGSWIDQLSQHFEEVGLLLPKSDHHSSKQDFKISRRNVKLYSLPTSKSLWTKFPKYLHTRKICKRVAGNYDILLIRGITPKQSLVYRWCDEVTIKAFLLVGSLYGNKPRPSLSLGFLILYFFYHLRRWEFKLISQRETIMLANSPALVSEIKKWTGCEASFVSTNTISIRDFTLVKREYSSSTISILFVGRIVKDKGIIELFNAYNLIKISGVNLYLDMVGPIEEGTKRRLVELIDVHKRNNVKFHGYVPFGEKLFDIYKSSHLYVLPSYHEGFPHTIWEAGAFNLPIITTPVGGIPGIVNHHHVFYVKPKSIDDLVEAMTTVITNHTEREKRVRAMYEYTKNYTVEASAKALCRALGIA